ncbi:MAG: hypothetical protein AAB897_01460 [Patescibacteria group bacterium]
MTKEIRGDTATPEEWRQANEKLGDLEYAGTTVDKLENLKSVYDVLTPEQKSRLRELMKGVISLLG